MLRGRQGVGVGIIFCGSLNFVKAWALVTSWFQPAADGANTYATWEAPSVNTTGDVGGNLDS